jgi:hypothetical protein
MALPTFWFGASVFFRTVRQTISVVLSHPVCGTLLPLETSTDKDSHDTLTPVIFDMLSLSLVVLIHLAIFFVTRSYVL